MLLQKQQPGLIGGRTVFSLKCPLYIHLFWRKYFTKRIGIACFKRFSIFADKCILITIKSLEFVTGIYRRAI